MLIVWQYFSKYKGLDWPCRLITSILLRKMHSTCQNLISSCTTTLLSPTERTFTFHQVQRDGWWKHMSIFRIRYYWYEHHPLAHRSRMHLTTLPPWQLYPVSNHPYRLLFDCIHCQVVMKNYYCCSHSKLVNLDVVGIEYVVDSTIVCMLPLWILLLMRPSLELIL